MRRAKSHKTEELGTGTVHDVVTNDLDWIFRDARLPDYGIDAFIEIVGDDEVVTGRLIAVQIKGGDSWFDSPRGEEGWVFREDNKHLSYWLGHALPVIVVLVDSRRRAYWQLVAPHTVTEHQEGFSLVVPSDQCFGATARGQLQEVAGRREGLLELFAGHLAVLPPDTADALSRAEPVDALAAARLAERLAAGRGAPDLTAASLVAAQPSWLAASPAAQDLWCAVGSYADQHQVPAAAGAHLLAAGCDGPRSARALAAAGLALARSDKAESRRCLLEAREQGLVLLADIGLSLLDLPGAGAHAMPIPESISAADPAQLAAEPTAFVFLADMAHRRAELEAAVAYAEQAVMHCGPRETISRLTLAFMVFHRALAGDMSGRQLRRALALAREVTEERRRWDGPAAEALVLMLDIYILLGDSPAAVAAALPVSLGGTARDSEAGRPEIARRGALAALSVPNDGAYEFFLQQLPDGPHRWELLAVEADGTPRPDQERIAERLALLADGGDDELNVRSIAVLAKLGVWPPQADQMRERGVLPGEVHQILAAVHRARSGDSALGIARLRQLSAASVHAAMELIETLEHIEGPDAAITEAERQLAVHQHPDLGLRLMDLLVRYGHDDRAAELARATVADEAVPAHTRLRLALWYASREGEAERYHEAAAFAARALEIGDDPQLAWLLIKSLNNAGRVEPARLALARHRPEPVTDDEMHLWMRLHIGVPLTPRDAPTMIAIAERQSNGPFRDATIRLLAREVLHTPAPEPGRFPNDVVEAARRLYQQADDRPGSPLSLAADDDETLRAAMRTAQPDPAQYDKLVQQVRAGRTSLAELARFVGRSYGAALIQRPAGLIPAVDLRPGLRRAGQEAAAAALDAGTCVTDLSALHVMGLLGEDDQLRLLAALPDLVVARTAIGDATVTRDQMRSQSIATYTAVLRSDGTLERSTLTAQQRAVLQQQSQRLENLATSQQARMPAVPTDAAADAIAVAREAGLTLWCDDGALRQTARQAGVPTFSVLDLLTVFGGRVTDFDQTVPLRTLAGQYVVDLPLDAEDIIAIALAEGWASGPIHTALGRAEWWEFHDPDWASTWRAIAAAACRDGGESLASITATALGGALAYVPSGRNTQRYLQLVVLALAACHHSQQLAPNKFLSELEAMAAPGIPPQGRHVRNALAAELESHGVSNAAAIASGLVPDADAQ